MKHDNYIRLDQCKNGYLYNIDSRNLELGVYDGNQGFIGIRTKFGNRYLSTEYHYDQGAPHGTVFPLEELERIPLGIQISEWIITPGIDGRPMNKPLFDYLDNKLAKWNSIPFEQTSMGRPGGGGG